MQMKLGYRPEEAAEVIGSKVLFEDCVAAGWIKPKVQRHKLTLYDFSEIAALWERICKGDQPQSAPRRTPRKTSIKEATNV
jgi:hypothetical protein